RRLRVDLRPLVDAAVGLLDQLDHALGPAAVDARVVQRPGCERGRDLAGTGAAHAVRDREQRWLEDVRIFVVMALSAGIGTDLLLADAKSGHDSNLRSVSPTRTTSPGASRRSRVRRMPFTNVPFVEPMSSR